MTVFESLLVRNQGTTCKRSIIRLAILLATVQLSLVPLTAAQLCIQNYTFPNRVYGLAFSGQNMFAVGTNATMSQWAIGNATTLMSYSLPGYAGYAQGIATNGSHVFVGVNTSTILQFSIGNVTAPVGRFVYPGGSQVNSLVIAGDILFSGHSDGVVRQWQISNSSLVRSFSAQNNFIWQMSINDDNLFIAGGNSGLLVQWRISTASVVQSYQSNIILNAVASAGDLLFAGGYFSGPAAPFYINQYRVRVAGHTMLSTFYGSTGAINSLAVAGDYLFAGCADNTVKQWQISTVQFIRNFTGHTGNVWSIAINGQFLFSASVDFTVKQWQVAELCAAGRFWNGTACVNCPANQYSASVGNTVCVVCPAGQYSVAGSASCVACSLLWNGTMCINNGTSTTAITSRTTTTSVDPSAPSSVNFINSLFTDSTYQLVFFIATCAFGGIVLLLCLAVLIICLKQRKLGPNGKEQSMPRSSIGRPPTVAMFTQPQPAAEDFYYN